MLEHKCEVCGRMWRKKLKADNKIVCNKHYKQWKKKGFFTDCSPRTSKDRNNIIIEGNISYIELYDVNYNVRGKAIIDTEDIHLIKNYKWRLSHGYVISGQKKNVYLHRIVLQKDTFVDHINGNPLDNRKSNLRVTNHSLNQMNTNHKGIYPRGEKWIAKIKINQKQVHLGVFLDKNEAYYARWCAEQILFKEHAFKKEEPNIQQWRKKEIECLIENKVQRL